MNFWLALLGILVATVLVYAAVSINGVTEHHEDDHHGHGHDDHH